MGIALLLTAMGRASNIGEDAMVGLSIADGLAGETVNRVMTDHSGQVWIATNSGVNLYNGKRLATFLFSDTRNRLVAVHDLCETADKSIYAATDEGLYRLAMGGKAFAKVLPEVLRPICLLAVGDTVYIGGKQGFQMYDGRRLKHIDVGVSRKGYDNIVNQYQKGDDGLIWFVGRYTLNSYDPRNGKITSISLLDVIPERGGLSQLCKVGRRFFVGTRNKGLWVYDADTNRAEQVAGVGHLVMSVSLSADGYVCVATDGAGAYLIDPGTREIVESYNMEQTGLRRLPANAVYSFYRDANGVNWFGFVRYGLAYASHSGTLFQPYRKGDFTTLGKNVRSFLLRGDECVIGSQSGFWFVTEGSSRFFSPEEFGGHIVNSIAWWQGEYYIGTFDGGLRVLDPQTMNLHRLAEVPHLDDAAIGAIKVGPDGRLWIGCSDGLFILEKNDGKVTVRNHYTEQNSHIAGGILLSITFDQRDNAWLTGIQGVSLYSGQSKEVVDTQFPAGFFNNEPNMLGILGHDGIIYMRNGPQLFYTTEGMREYGELRLPVRLSDKWCRAMADDMEGHLWLGSERGLLRFDYGLEHLLQFGYGEGLSGDQISEVCIDGNKRLWVATSRGLFSADLKELEQWTRDGHYKVQLYNLRLGSDLLTSTEEMAVNEKRRVRLSWNFTSEVLQAEAVLLDFARQQGRLYEYRLDGGSWRLVQDGESIDVRNLFIGLHQLEVRLAGVEGSASVYHLSVVPSLWAVLEAMLLVAILSAAFVFYRYRKNTKVLLSERDEIEEALIESEELRVQGEELPKYQRVRIDDEECADIVKRMRAYIERDKVYTDVDLKMKDLAEELHLSPSKLSQVFSLYLNENYYDFINRYRLNEFKRLIAEGEYKRYTITALSERCGFKKSNFFSTFRKVEGMTPAEYLRKQGVKA